MSELLIKFETEKDKEDFASSVLSSATAGVLADYDANTITRTGDTLFFTKQPEPTVPNTVPVAVEDLELDVDVPETVFDPFNPFSTEVEEFDEFTEVANNSPLKEVDED